MGKVSVLCRLADLPEHKESSSGDGEDDDAEGDQKVPESQQVQQVASSKGKSMIQPNVESLQMFSDESALIESNPNEQQIGDEEVEVQATEHINKQQ